MAMNLFLIIVTVMIMWHECSPRKKKVSFKKNTGKVVDIGTIRKDARERERRIRGGAP